MTEPIDPELFRGRVLATAQAAFPELSISAPPTEWDLLVVGGTQIGLANMRAKFQLSEGSEEELEAIVRDHLAALTQVEGDLPPFGEARQRLRPQIMPMDFAVEMPLIAFPFAPLLMVGLVLDSERSYQYLRPEHAEKWGRTHLQLLDEALANLDRASDGIGLHYSENEESKIIFAQQADGFDAARVLMPKLRQLAADRLGAPFYFAIPNRDFLMMWNLEAGAEFQETLRNQIALDFGCQPYPLSPKVFTLSAEGEIHEA